MFLGRSLFNLGERILAKLPIVNTIYNTIKQITSAFSGSTVKSFQQVIFIQYPREGLWTMCFVTNQSQNEKGEDFIMCLCPQHRTPHPVYLLLYLKRMLSIRTLPLRMD